MDYYGLLLLWPNPNLARPGIWGILAADPVADCGGEGAGGAAGDDDDREKRWFPFVVILSRGEFITWRLA